MDDLVINCGSCGHTESDHGDAGCRIEITLSSRKTPLPCPCRTYAPIPPLEWT